MRDIFKIKNKIFAPRRINRILHENANRFTKDLLITRITVTSYSVEISNEDYTKSCTYRYEIRFTLPRGIYLPNQYHTPILGEGGHNRRI